MSKNKPILTSKQTYTDMTLTHSIDSSEIINN